MVASPSRHSSLGIATTTNSSGLPGSVEKGFSFLQTAFVQVDIGQLHQAVGNQVQVVTNTFLPVSQNANSSQAMQLTATAVPSTVYLLQYVRSLVKVKVTAMYSSKQ